MDKDIEFSIKIERKEDFGKDVVNQLREKKGLNNEKFDIVDKR